MRGEKVSGDMVPVEEVSEAAESGLAERAVAREGEKAVRRRRRDCEGLRMGVNGVEKRFWRAGDMMV